jgi:hypothetical protein
MVCYTKLGILEREAGKKKERKGGRGRIVDGKMDD